MNKYVPQIIAYLKNKHNDEKHLIEMLLERLSNKGWISILFILILLRFARPNVILASLIVFLHFSN